MKEFNPVVSVCFITYNQEKYIRKALESVINQKVNFEFEIIIHDDCSTDSTPQIIEEYRKKYPKLIKTILQVENQYSKNKSPLIDFLSPMTNGKYIAILEGDDYWCNENKLQMQVSCLEENADCFLCVHDTKTVDREDHLSSYKFPPIQINKSIIPNYEYIHYEIAEELWMFQTSSYMVRAEIFKKYTEVKKEIFAQEFYKVGDLPLVLYCLNYGNVYYINKVMSCYRVDSGGHMSRMKRDIEFQIKVSSSYIRALQRYNLFSNLKFNDDILLGIKKRKFGKCLAENNYRIIFSDYYQEVLNSIKRRKILFYKFLAISPAIPKSLKRFKKFVRNLRRKS